MLRLASSCAANNGCTYARLRLARRRDDRSGHQRLGPASVEREPARGTQLCRMVVLAIALRDPVPATYTMARLPRWAWSGGISGAIFIALSIVTIPKLGGAAYIAILVTGQLIAALAFDHFGWLGISKDLLTCRGCSVSPS